MVAAMIVRPLVGSMIVILAGWFHACADVPVTGGNLVQFDNPCPLPKHAGPELMYTFDLAQEHFWVYVPAGYDGSAPWGLIVYDSPEATQTDLADGWAQVLADDKLLFIAPQNAGNDQPSNRRGGLCVVAALEMMKLYSIDPKRVYAAGFSGGARIASALGFFQSDMFHATIQCSGTDFYKAVPKVAVTDADTAQNPKPYGQLNAQPDEIANARQSVKFTISTGSGDFRERFIQDIYNGGFAADGFQAKLWDVNGMGHEPCSASTLRDMLTFIEGGTPQL